MGMSKIVSLQVSYLIISKSFNSQMNSETRSLAIELQTELLKVNFYI